MRTGCIVQSRLGSSRLPRKALAKIEGKPMLQRVLERASLIKGIDTVILATTWLPEDTALQDLARSMSLACYRGDPDNVLDRYMNTATLYSLDNIMRITGDCPMLDWNISGMVLDKFKEGRWDYVSNVHPSTWPNGLDTEVFTFKALDKAHSNAIEQFDKEHVSPFIWKLGSGFSKANIWADRDYSNLRWTVDVPQDLEFVRKCYAHFESEYFGFKDLLAWEGGSEHKETKHP